ncbi:MAG TPA: ABC transporter ATP-binding protein [Anaerolineaceae bacterium]|nr:ABC transporter ATP-binding protein [Anaerolineaceae bacterium]
MTAKILSIHNLKISRNQVPVLDIEDFSINQGELLAVIGPNGAGKSTLILALSGLLPWDQGELHFQNQKINTKDLFSYRRKIGMVLQNPLLLDDSVENNITVGLRFRGVSKKESNQQAKLWMERLGIEHLAKRKARQLSGGEGQRVSLARAMVLKPDLLFLDEPFGALDAPTRTRLIEDFIELQKQEAISTFFVTHDQNEALWMGNRVAVIMDGKLRQIGRPDDIFNSPLDADVAGFVGTETIIPGTVSSVEDGIATIKVDGYSLEVVGDVHAGQNVYICIRPEHITLWKDKEVGHSSARNFIRGSITQITPQGVLDRLILDCGFNLVALITRTSTRDLNLSVGMSVAASFKSSSAHLVVRSAE